MFEKEAGYRPLRKSTIGDYSKLKIVHCILKSKTHYKVTGKIVPNLRWLVYKVVALVYIRTAKNWCTWVGEKWMQIVVAYLRTEHGFESFWGAVARLNPLVAGLVFVICWPCITSSRKFFVLVVIRVTQREQQSMWADESL